MATNRLIPAALLPLALVACGDGAAAGSAGITIKATSALTADATAGALVFQDDAGVTYTATQALMRIREIELELPRGVNCADIESELAGGAWCDRDDDFDDDDSDDEIKIRGPFVVDLLTGTSTPSLADVRVPALTYREVEFELNDDDESGELRGHSFLLRADFDDGGTPAQLVLRLDGGSDVEIERAGGVTVDSGSSLLVLLDASVWLRGVPLQECIAEQGLQVVDGVLAIDESSDCDDLEDAFHEKLEASCSLDDDDDDDDDRNDDDDDDRFDD